jgi:hypothetical protein
MRFWYQIGMREALAGAYSPPVGLVRLWYRCGHMVGRIRRERAVSLA